MNKYHRITVLLAVLFCTSCTTILDSTTNKPIEPDPGKRSFGTYLDDERLETIARVNINKASPELKRANVNVNSFNNIILLTGQAPSLELKQLAEQTAAKIDSVRKVYNEIQIKGNTAVLVKTNDSWLATKVKTAFVTHKMVKSSKIKIIVDDSVVYLMGKLTDIEASQAASVASNVGGVQEVVKVFEYLPQQ